MQTLSTLISGKEVKIIRPIIAELEAEKQTILVKIRLMDQVTDKLWSNQVRK